MKSAIGFATKVLFYAMSAGLLVLMASYTLSFVAFLFPEDWIKQWGSILIFDGGAIIWFLIFLTKAEGAGQRGTSLLMGAVDLLGGLIIAGAEIFGAAQSYMGDQTMIFWLRETATWILFIWLGVNIAATWIFHVTDPKQQEEMRARNIQDQVTAKSLDMAEAKVNQVASQIADELSDVMYTNVLASLNIKNQRLLPKQIIDLQANEPLVTPPPTYTPREQAPVKRSWKNRTVMRPAYNAETPAASEATGVQQTPNASEPNHIITDSRNGATPQKGGGVDPTHRRTS